MVAARLRIVGSGQMRRSTSTSASAALAADHSGARWRRLVVRPVARSKACRVRSPVDAFGIDPQPGASGIKSRVSVVRVLAKPGQRHIGG